MDLTAAYKYFNIKDTSSHKTKAVERSQNSGDLYPTWYNKYERSAWFVGEGCNDQIDKILYISGENLMVSSEAIWMRGRLAFKENLNVISSFWLLRTTTIFINPNTVIPALQKPMLTSVPSSEPETLKFNIICGHLLSEKMLTLQDQPTKRFLFTIINALLENLHVFWKGSSVPQFCCSSVNACSNTTKQNYCPLCMLLLFTQK